MKPEQMKILVEHLKFLKERKDLLKFGNNAKHFLKRISCINVKISIVEYKLKNQ
jgi:hypothetical protein